MLGIDQGNVPNG